jgi:thiamine-monophosphate kinase
MKEFRFIDSVRNRITIFDPSVIKGIGDDCAVIDSGAKKMLLTTDSMYENVHFCRKYFKPREIGFKAMAINISDICAMGGTPKYALVNIGMPVKDSGAYGESIMRGIVEYAENYGVTVIGGDTVKSDRLFLSVTLVGEAGKNILMRSGAKPGDRIFVTGYLGDSFAGYKVLMKKGRNKTVSHEYYPVKKHLTPSPRFIEGLALSASGCVSSCMDISDGIISDAARICSESGVAAEINADILPVSYSAAQVAGSFGDDPVDYALYGGEDYELLFTVPEQLMDRFIRYCKKSALQFFEAGIITKGSGVSVRRGGKIRKESFAKVWKHF